MIASTEYNKMRPFEQGYVRYAHSSEMDPLIPEVCPYPPEAPAALEWLKGYTQAVKEKTTEAVVQMEQT